MIKRTLSILSFLIILSLVSKSNLVLAQNNKNVLCLFDKKSSSVSKGEINKFLKAAEFSSVKWSKELEEHIAEIDYLVLSKGKLENEEQDIIVRFLRSGGGLVLFLSKEHDEAFLKEIGLRRYDIYGDNLAVEYNREFFKDPIEGELSSNKGVLVKTGYGGDIRQPDRGNIFPERIPVRDFNILSKVVDEDGNFLGSNIVLVKHWMNPWDLKERAPLRWLIFSSSDINLTKKDYRKISEILNRDIVIKDLSSNYPLYYQGEDTGLSLSVFNPLRADKRVRFLVELSSDSNTVYSIYQERVIKEGLNKLDFEVQKDLAAGFYRVKCSLIEGRSVYDQFNTAFLVVDKSWADKGSDLKVKEGKILFNGRDEFLWGINYYESKRGELNWVWPNPYYINEDFKLMHEMGLKIVRIHYHHPKWFKDYLKFIGSGLTGYFPDKDYLPDEYDLRILDSFIYLAKMNNLIISFDLFTLIPLEMGDPRGWLSLTKRITDRERIEKQLEFVRIISNRYKDLKGISWDLWNEPRVPEEHKEDLKVWVREIISEFRKNGDNHLITLGGNDSLFLEEYLDYTSYHTDNVLDIISSTKPLLLQEFWLPRSLDKELEQLEELEDIIINLKDSNYQGFMPWQWTRQSRLWDRSDPEEWDDDLGLFLREDSSFKLTTALFLNKPIEQ
ncbi:MAG: cellulase family glycosylhydrolase [Candidatus Kaelpia aquatica]|nr:cellulase family glycosylhydrolase [Candidatus Kaelpia aquatica]